MKSSIIVYCYQKISKVDLNRFGLFVNSSYFNKNKAVKKLHETLALEYPSFLEENISKEKILSVAFPDKKISEQKLKDLQNILLRLFKEFLANENLKKNTLLMQRITIEESLDANLSRLSKKLLKQSFASSSQSEEDRTTVLYQKYALNDLAYVLEETAGKRMESAVYLQNRANYLDKFYLSEKLMLGAAMMNRGKVLKTSFELNHYDYLEKYAMHLEKSEENIGVILNREVYQLQKTEDKTHYFKLREELKTAKLNAKEKKNYYAFLRNHCIGKINAGNQTFLPELMELNKLAIEEGLLIENGKISEWTYKNFIALAIRLKEYEWTEAFIKDYSQYLDPKIYNNAYNFSYASVMYSRKSYDLALQHLLHVEYTDVFYLLSSKALLLKVYYETNELETLEHLLHSFRLLTKRQKKVSVKQKKSYLGMIKLTELLLKIKYQQSIWSKEKFHEEIEKVKLKLNTTESLANKTWIQEKLAEISSSI